MSRPQHKPPPGGAPGQPGFSVVENAGAEAPATPVKEDSSAEKAREAEAAARRRRNPPRVWPD